MSDPKDLYWALRTRVLTDEEMKEVERHGYAITIEPGVPFFEHEKRMEFNAALLNQFKMRQMVAGTGNDAFVLIRPYLSV